MSTNICLTIGDNFWSNLLFTFLLIKNNFRDGCRQVTYGWMCSFWCVWTFTEIGIMLGMSCSI